MRLTAELMATGGGSTTGFRVPDDFVTALGAGGRPKVVVTINGYEFRSSIARMGGEYWLGVSAERRDAAGVRAGEVLDLDVDLDLEVREVTVPDDLTAALAADPGARQFWETLSYSNRRYHVEQVTGAKTDVTRERRVAKAVQMLGEGRAR